MTEDKILCCFQIAFIIMDACFKVKLSYSGKGPWALGYDWVSHADIVGEEDLRQTYS